MIVRFFATFRKITRGVKERSDLQAEDLQELLNILSRQYGREFQDRLFDGDDLSSEVIILVNGTHVSHLQGLNTPLQQGDVVAVFPRVMGG